MVRIKIQQKFDLQKTMKVYIPARLCKYHSLSSVSGESYECDSSICASALPCPCKRIAAPIRYIPDQRITLQNWCHFQ